MTLLNFIVNLFGLVLWLNWLSSRLDPLAQATPNTLAGTLKRTGSAGPKRWKFMAALLALLVARAWLCLQISGVANWAPKLKWGVIVLSFRGDFMAQALVFSLLSFGSVLAGFYLWLLLADVANGAALDQNPLQKLVRFHLKWLARMPIPFKLLLPFLSGGLAWLVLHPLLTGMAVLPGAKSAVQLFEQAAVIGAGTYLAWKYFILGLLVLNVLNSHVHLGNHPGWNFVEVTSRNLLAPLRGLPLRAGRVDFLPLAVIAAMIALMVFLACPPEPWRQWFYRHLPF